MTLILARASAEFVLQVTDRLVSLNQKPFDKLANKNILYIASNAVVTLAYTGEAYLDNIPTDHWIAQKLLGFEIDPANPPAMAAGQNGSKRDIGQSFRILTDELDRQDPKKRLSLLVSVQGWQWNSRGRLRPLVGHITRMPSRNSFDVHFEQRDWYLKGAQTISAPYANIGIEELTELSNQLRDKQPKEAEVLLVDKIRQISNTNTWVGPHCISVLLPQLSNPNIFVRYHTADPSVLSNQQALEAGDDLWAYSPWIVGSNVCLPPAQVIGGFTLRTGPFTIHFEAETPQQKQWLSFHSGQNRKPPPV